MGTLTRDPCSVRHKGHCRDLFTKLSIYKVNNFSLGPSTNFTKLLFLCYENNKHSESGATDFTAKFCDFVNFVAELNPGHI